mgnify:CR=1 FL=1
MLSVSFQTLKRRCFIIKISALVRSAVPPMSVIQQNLNRPLPKILKLFFDVLDALTPSWMVELVGNRKYMMEEDFLRVADNLKAATSPGK